MAYAQTFRSGKPALGEHAFSGFHKIGTGSAAMTLGGSVNKTALSLLIVMATASITWNRGAVDPWLSTWMMVGIIVAMVTVLKQKWAPFTTPAYAALEGLALGGLSILSRDSTLAVSYLASVSINASALTSTSGTIFCRIGCRPGLA